MNFKAFVIRLSLLTESLQAYLQVRTVAELRLIIAQSVYKVSLLQKHYKYLMMDTRLGRLLLLLLLVVVIDSMRIALKNGWMTVTIIVLLIEDPSSVGIK